MWTSCRREALVAEADGLPVVAVDGLPVVAAVVVHVWGVLLLVGSAVVVRPPAVVFQLGDLPVAVVAADPCLPVAVAAGPQAVVVMPAAPAADLCPLVALVVDHLVHHPLEVIGITMVLPVPLGVWALPSSERLLSRPLQLPLAR